MFKLVFLLVVLVAVAAANSHPRKSIHPKKASASALQKHSSAAVHHGLDLHGHVGPAPRAARSHKPHAPVHHAPGGSAHHSNKVGGVHGVHGGAHAGKKGVRPVKHRGHRK